MPRISILLPCRDAASHLSECIASVDAQTFREFEVIAVDDGSADTTSETLADWAARDPRVRVIHCERNGLVPALIAGLGTANGEFIARMDADDIAHAARFARQVELLAARSLAACGTGVHYFPRGLVREGAREYERWVNSLVEPDDIARDIFVECAIPHPTLMIRRTVLEAVGGYRDVAWAEDYDLLLRLWTAQEPLGKVAEVLLDWREGPERLSRTDARYSDESFRRCKVHYLKATLLRGRPELVVCGAGPVGKSFARELQSSGFRHPRVRRAGCAQGRAADSRRAGGRLRVARRTRWRLRSGCRVGYRGARADPFRAARSGLGRDEGFLRRGLIILPNIRRRAERCAGPARGPDRSCELTCGRAERRGARPASPSRDRGGPSRFSR